MREIVALMGLRWAGKTMIGNVLAKSMGKRFVDLDQRIEQEVGMTIKDYVGIYGFPAFRKLEQDTLKKVVTEDVDTILSLWGGTLTFEEVVCDWKKISREVSQQILHNAQATLVLIDVEREELINRLTQDTQRPRLRSWDTVEQEVEYLFSSRDGVQRELADVIIMSQPKVIDTLELLEKRLKISVE